MPLARPLTVFLSSTCYDLADLRAELAEALNCDGLLVSRSEDPASSFLVDPTDDSIESCLRNVEAADAIVCILDRRYGPVLRGGDREGRSATHVEIEHARKHSRPVFFFARERALHDFDALKADRDFKTRWVEPDDVEARVRWYGFVKYIAALPKHDGWSNWCDQFKTSFDLKALVRKRLVDRFPAHAGTTALHPDRVIRLSFTRGGDAPGHFFGSFQNVGVGPAFKVRHGIVLGHEEAELGHRGGLADGGMLLDHRGQPHLYLQTHVRQPADSAPRVVFCEYENRFGDEYRVEVPVLMKDALGTLEQGRERLLVRLHDRSWHPVGG